MKIDSLRRALAYYDSAFDPGASLLRVTWWGAGNHTRVVNGSMVHPLRESLDCALALFETKEPERVSRARDVLGAVLPLQDLKSCSATFGIWPYLMEESLEEMNPPDWNWADFCGIRLAHILVRYEPLLSAEMRQRIVTALEAAALSIFRRNVGPGYTNIAIKGAVVSGLAGQIAGQAFLAEYAVQRLGGFLDYCRTSGGFSEYNSPAYGEVVMQEIERGLLLTQNAELKELLWRIHEVFWEAIALTLHLPTGQLCGPQSRAYRDRLTAGYADALSERLGMPVPQPKESGAEQESLAGILPDISYLVPAVSCPKEIQDRIAKDSLGFSTHAYVRADDPAALRVASIWRTAEVCLGSINYDNLWTQRRPLLGYWLADGDLARLRIRMTHDGQDFASSTLRAIQHEGNVLAVASLATNKGDFHDHLDRPKDGVFRFSNLALAIELNAPDAQVLERDGGFILSAGEWSVSILPGEARFGDFPVRWECSRSDCGVAVRALVNEGKCIGFVPDALETCVIPFSLSLARTGAGAMLRFETKIVDGKMTLTSHGNLLELISPLRAGPVKDHFTR